VEKNENRGTNRNGRRFDEEFKLDAVAMLKSGERSAQQLSQELGVSVWSLKRWSKEFSIGGQTGPGALTLSEPASALRHGETISTAFVESAINQVLSKRFVKRQQMRWTDRGAHLLLQVRTKVLDEDWRSTLSRWYPGMEETCDAKAA
jgi:transposase-like protein